MSRQFSLLRHVSPSETNIRVLKGIDRPLRSHHNPFLFQNVIINNSYSTKRDSLVSVADNFPLKYLKRHFKLYKQNIN